MDLQNPSVQFSTFFDPEADLASVAPSRSSSEQLDPRNGRLVSLSLITLIADTDDLPADSFANVLLPVIVRCARDEAQEIRKMAVEALVGLARVVNETMFSEDLVSFRVDHLLYFGSVSV